jgi:hypothetical protein
MGNEHDDECNNKNLEDTGEMKLELDFDHRQNASQG